MRKEKEVVDLGKTLRRREEVAVAKVRDMEQNLAKLEKEKLQMKAEIENTVRREWEVKARLEIDRQVQSELERLRKRFETEVQDRVSIEVKKHKANNSNSRDDVFRTSTHGSSSSRSSGQGWRSSRSSANMTDDSDNTPSNTADITQLSLGSPPSSKRKQPKKETRTPFCRSKTVVDSPVDVQMAEPSPISIASLSLSPRRTSGTGGARNIFAEAERNKAKWEPTLAYSDDEDDTPDLPSPTRPKVKPDPLKAPRRPLLRQHTAAFVQKLSTQPSLFPSSGTRLPQSTNASASQTEERSVSESRAKSPHRRLTKIPSSANLAADASPTRKNASKQTQPKADGNGGREEMMKAVLQRNMGGRTLVELAQARAGGRPMDEVKRCASDSRSSGPSMLKCSERDPPAIWNPDVEEMPSPFLARGKKVIRNLR
jgi:NIMA (never in mitosis gene a)-related kinase